MPGPGQKKVIGEKKWDINYFTRLSLDLCMRSKRIQFEYYVEFVLIHNA